jgi:hypothetical protein
MWTLPIGRAWNSTGLTATAAVLLCALVGPGAAQAQGRPTLQGLQDQVTALQRATACLDLPTVEVEVPAVAMGSYLASGAHLANLPLVGQFLDGPTLRGPYRSYFAYDLRRLQPAPVLNNEDLVLSGELVTYNKSVVRNGVDGFQSDGTDTLTLVLNRAAWMSNDGVAQLISGAGGAAAFVDLADGPVYADYVASAANNGIQFNIRLSDMAIRDINRSNGGLTDRDGRLLFAIGGAITPLVGVTGNAVILGGGVPYASLLLKLKRYQGTGCAMPTGTQYQ